MVAAKRFQNEKLFTLNKNVLRLRYRYTVALQEVFLFCTPKQRLGYILLLYFVPLPVAFYTTGLPW